MNKKNLSNLAFFFLFSLMSSCSPEGGISPDSPSNPNQSLGPGGHGKQKGNPSGNQKGGPTEAQRRVRETDRLSAELGLKNLTNTCFFNALINLISVPTVVKSFVTPLKDLDADAKASYDLLLAILNQQAASHQKIEGFFDEKLGTCEKCTEKVNIADLSATDYPKNYKEQELRALYNNLNERMKDKGRYLDDNLATAFLMSGQADASEVLGKLLSMDSSYSKDFPFAVLPFVRGYYNVRVSQLDTNSGFFSQITEKEIKVKFDAAVGILPLAMERASSANMKSVIGIFNDSLVQKAIPAGEKVYSEKQKGKKFGGSVRNLFAIQQGKVLPSTMILSLGRFYNEGLNSGKIDSPVAFKKELIVPYYEFDPVMNLNPWQESENGKHVTKIIKDALNALEKWGRPIFLNPAEGKKSQTYVLRSLVYQTGDLHSGHYLSLVYHPPSSAGGSGFWTHHNDHILEIIPERQFKSGNPYYEAVLRNGYLFLYTAKGT